MREEDPPADVLRALIAHRAAQGTPFAVPVFCVGELWRIVTDRRASSPNTPPRARVDRSPALERRHVADTWPGYWTTLKTLLARGLPEGLGVFDCQIAGNLPGTRH